jgi:hypothetical protein
MNIIQAFETLQRYGHVTDQYNFDKSWLGKKPGYFAYLKSTRRQPSVETLMRFHLRLLEQINKHSRWGLMANELSGLAQITMDEIKQRCS